MIVPERNVPDLEEIPKEAKRRLRFIPVSTMDQVLAAALEAESPAPRKRTPSRASGRTSSVPASASSKE